MSPGNIYRSSGNEKKHRKNQILNFKHLKLTATLLPNEEYILAWFFFPDQQIALAQFRTTSLFTQRLLLPLTQS